MSTGILETLSETTSAPNTAQDVTIDLGNTVGPVVVAVAFSAALAGAGITVACTDPDKVSPDNQFHSTFLNIGSFGVLFYFFGDEPFTCILLNTPATNTHVGGTSEKPKPRRFRVTVPAAGVGVTSVLRISGVRP